MASALYLPGRAGSLMRTRARTFYVASLFLPGRLRRDTRLAYAFYRMVDDLVDEPPPGWTSTDILSTLDAWERTLLSGKAEEGSILAELTRLVDEYQIPRRYLVMVLDGARFDLDMREIETREELHRYAVLVAGSVGMVMSQILGAREEEARAAACDLGVAMQLTNVLRDVGEDLRRGRIYLPREELERAGCSREALQRELVTDGLVSVLRSVIDEAREMYRRGMEGIHYLHPSATFSIYLAATLYARILDKIEQQGFDVFRQRACLSPREKWLAAPSAYVRHRAARHRRYGAEGYS